MSKNQYPLPEEPKTMIAHFTELKQSIVTDVENDSDYAEEAQFSLSCIDNILASLEQFEKSKQSDLSSYVSIIAHLELFNSIFGDEEGDDEFFDFEEEEEDEGHHHGDSCCKKKSPCDS